MRGFLIALQHLTIIPVKRKEAVSKDILTKSMTFFPLAGLLLGAILVVVNAISSFLFPPLVAKAIVLVTLIILTGALPLEGFVKTYESFFRRKGVGETPDVMRENGLSARGIIALISLLLIKLALLYGLVARVEFGALLLMPVIGRWAMVVIGTLTPYAGEESKDDFGKKDNYRSLLRASIITFVISLLLFRFFVIPLMLIVYLSVWALRWFSLKKSGGISSNVLGATIEVMEVVTLLLINLIK